MAEVKQVSESFYLSSSKKKPPSFSNNGVSSSFKHIYDDVFGSASPSKQKSSSNYMEDDYAEVFGSSKSNNGCWSIPYSSIPVIDLPKGKDKDKNFASCRKGGERMDYSGVLGGIDDESFGLPNGEELFDHLKKKARTLPRIQRHATKTANPGISSKSCEQLPTNGYCQSFDNTKHFELGNNEMTKNSNSSRPRKAAHSRAYSMHEVSATQDTLSSQTPLIKDDEKSPPNGFCQSSDRPNHSELGDREMAMNANCGPINAAHVHANFLHEVSATQKTWSSHTQVGKDDGKSPTNGVCQSSDNRNHFESGDCEMTVNASSEQTKAAHNRGYSLHEVSDTHNSLSSETPVIKDDEISLTIGFCQSSDNMKHFEPGDSEMTVNAKSGPGKAAHVRAYSLHEGGATQKSLSSQTPVINYDGKSPTNGFCRSSDSMKYFEHGDSEMSANAKSESRKAAHVRAYSLHEVSDTQKSFNVRTPVIKVDAVDADSNFGKKQENHSRHISLDVSANKHDSDAGLQKVSGMSGSNSVDKCQPSKAAINEFCQSFSNTNDFEHKTNGTKNAQISGATNAVEVQPFHEPNHAVHEVGPSQKIPSSTKPLPNDETQSRIDFNLAENQGKQSYNTSLDGGADKQNSDCDAGFQKACGLGESISVGSSHETCQVSVEASPSKAVENNAEVAVGYVRLKKKGRRSRMNSLDLNDYKHSGEHDSGNQRKPRFGSSYSFDASHDPSAAHVQVQPSKMYPSSSLPRFFPVESHYKISENSSCKSSQKNMYRGGMDSPPSLAEELDINSPAAVSAAALQRAIEEAEMRIRWAKSFLERECQGSTNMRFKDTLKVTVAKENGLTNEINKFKQPKRDDSFSSVESVVQPCPPSERQHVTTNTQVAPVFEDQEKFFKDGNFTEVTDAKASEWMREDEKCEGGEWEAAKHLNQILSGVKNKIASFMSWQTESEKKEDLREIETNTKHQQLPEEAEHDLKDYEVLEGKIREKSQVTTTTCAVDTVHEEDEENFTSEAVEPEEKESVRGVNAKQEKVGNEVHVIPVTAEPSLVNFRFYAFRNQRTCDPPVSDIEEEGPLEIRESQIEKDQEQVISEVNDEHLLFQNEDSSLDELGDELVTQDWERQNDMCDVGSSDGENDKAIEEPNALAGHNDIEHSHEECIEDDMNSKGDVCSVNEENIELAEELDSSTVHLHKEFTHELAGQDDMDRKNQIGFINEENVEIVQEPYPLAEHDMKSFSAEEGGQDELWKINLGSNDKENDAIAEELYTQSGHERTNDVHEEDNDTCLNEEYEVELLDHADYSVITTERTDKDECGSLMEAELQHNSLEINEDTNVVAETWKNSEATEGVFSEDEIKTNHIEEAPGQKYGWEENKPEQNDNVKKTAEEVAVEATCVVSDEDGVQNQNELRSKAEEASSFVERNSKIEVTVHPDEVTESMLNITNNSFEPEIKIVSPVPVQLASELIREEPEVTPSTESITKLGSNRMESCNGAMGIFQCETVMSTGEKDVDVKVVEPQSQDNLENQTDFFYESREMLHVEDYDTASDQDLEMPGVEAVHRRRRWFDNRGSIATAERPSILEGNRTDLELEQEVLDESELAGSVEIHADKVDCSAAEVATARDAEVSSNQGCSRTNVEITPKRRRWFVKRGEEGTPEPLSLFEGVKVNLEVPLESNCETLLHKENVLDSCIDQLNTGSGESLNEVKSDVSINGGKGKQSGEAAPRRKRWFESRERVEPGQQVRIDGDVGLSVELDQEIKGKGDAEKLVKPVSMTIPQEKDDVHSKVESKEQQSNVNEVNRKEKEREKEKLAVERAIREARERAFVEARERARRDAAERPNVETRQKVTSGPQEKPGKVSSEGTSSDKASVEAKLKAERAAVERATAEARERALQKSLSEKAFPRSKEQAGRYPNEKNSSLEPKFQSSRSSDGSNSSDKFEGVDVESAQRRKARLERQKRTTERAAKALEEKNRRDLVTQKEQAAKNMLADALDAEVRRWSTGKEGNLRALLSTLQYILGPDSGWQPVSLTDLVAATAVRKAYKKATLCVHPDKLQQRGASIQQKHICEKVFDLLKEAWSKFNPDER